VRIVLIEDEAAVANLIIGLLKAKGHTVTWSSETVAGLEAVSRERPDLVLSDIRMATNYNGFGIVTMLKRDPRTAHIPVVAVTGFAVAEDEARYQQMGFAGVIPKPLDVQGFATRVAEFVK
jgi:two-component system cell cycle response regulator DivK